MEELSSLLSRLRGMIGTRVTFHNRTYTVVEIIDDIPAIIMQTDKPNSSIQADVHGRARKHTKEVITVSVLNSDKTGLHKDFLEISIL